MTFLSNPPRVVRLGELQSLNARVIALLAGRGGGKTRAEAELMTAPGLAFCAIDPAGELGRLLASSPDVDVLEVPRNWKMRPTFIPNLIGRLRAGGKVCLVASKMYREVPELVEAVVEAIWLQEVRNCVLVLEEVQRYAGQNRAGNSDAVRAAVEMGRNWACGVILATQRPASVDKEVLERADTLLLGRIQGARDADAVDDLLRMNVPNAAERASIIRAMLNLAPGTFIMRTPEHPPTVNQ